MRIVFDGNVPWPLRKFLPDHDVTSVQREGFGVMENGKLLEHLDGTRTLAENKALDEACALTHGFDMQTISATTARSMIYKLLDDAATSHEPIQITGKRSNGVLVAESDWRAIQETLYLVSIPGMRDSIRAGLISPIIDCDTELDW